MKHEFHRKKLRRISYLFWSAILVVMIVVVGVSTVSKSPSDYKYGFITVDHPISVEADRGGRWFYYMPTTVNGGAPKLAQMVRKELLPLGFTEDFSNKPWFRFVNGKREVIVCNHDEIATNGSVMNTHVFHETITLPPRATKWPVLWIYQPGVDTAGVALFQVKKLVYRW